jgi:hypothetical protein
VSTIVAAESNVALFQASHRQLDLLPSKAIRSVLIAPLAAPMNVAAAVRTCVSPPRRERDAPAGVGPPGDGPSAAVKARFLRPSVDFGMGAPATRRKARSSAEPRPRSLRPGSASRRRIGRCDGPRSCGGTTHKSSFVGYEPQSILDTLTSWSTRRNLA